jgi:hypothetical protein
MLERAPLALAQWRDKTWNARRAFQALSEEVLSRPKAINSTSRLSCNWYQQADIR